MSLPTAIRNNDPEVLRFVDSQSVEDAAMHSMFPTIFSALTAAIATAQAPDGFEVETLGGRTLKAADFEHSVLLVDFFGTWSDECDASARILQQLYAKYTHHGLEIVGLAYEGAGDDPAAAVREFAIERQITYPLGLGTPAHKKLIKTFRTYPTLLCFAPGMQLLDTRVRTNADSARALEDWVRAQLELEPLPRSEPVQPTEDDPAVRPNPADPPPLDLPRGVVFQPGDGDKGFAFEVEDSEGNKLKFSDLRGKPVLLAMTSTWDSSATASAKLLRTLHGEYGEHAHIVAASLELRATPRIKAARINTFRKKHGLKYPMFAAGVGFQKKIYQFTGMPMFLVFDPDGVLVLRESGIDEKAGEDEEIETTSDKIAATLDRYVGDK